MAKWKMNDEEFERQHGEAVRRGNEKMKTELQAELVRYDRAANRLVIDLKNGATFIVPCYLIQGLREADPDLIAEVELLPRGAALHWEKLDVDFSVTGLLAGLFGNNAWMSELARLGGGIQSGAKAVTVRETNREGGRPRKRA